MEGHQTSTRFFGSASPTTFVGCTERQKTDHPFSKVRPVLRALPSSIADMFINPVKIAIFALIISAFAVDACLTLPASVVVSVGAQVSSGNFQRAALSGWIESNDGRLRIALTNHSKIDFHGIVRIGLGNSEEQKEIGQIEVHLPANELSLLQVNGVNPSGDLYSLSVFNQKGARVFFKIAPIRSVSDSTPALAVALLPIQQPNPKTGTRLVITGKGAAEALIPAVDSTSAVEFAKIASQIQVEARLLANEETNDSFILSFDLRAQQSLRDATLAITAGKITDRKPVSVNLQSRVDFKLPINLENGKIKYLLSAKDGKTLAQGDLDLQELMTDDSVTVNDIRTDRAEYSPGESARITMVMEGKTKGGYRLEVSARDGQNQTIYQDQKTIASHDQSNSSDFVFTIPNNISTPLVFEFKVFSLDTGLLFDSGEREIMINGGSP